MSGQIECVGFWDRYLTDEEIRQLYNDGEAVKWSVMSDGAEE